MNASTELLSAQRVRHLLSAPHEATGADLMGLRAWRDRFPFSGALGVLIAKAAAEADSIDQQMELLRAAAHVPSREALFNLLVRPQLLSEAREAAAAIEALAWEDSDAAAEDGTALDLAINPVQDASDAKAEVHPSDAGGESVEVEPINLLDGVEREALLVAIESSLAQDVEELASERSSGEQPKPEVPQRMGLSPFAKWLEQRAQRTGFGAAGVHANPQADGTTPEGQALLIDAFIANNPKIGKLRDVGPEVEDLARQSVLEDATLVTETMARVYAKQGQLGKARKAYKLLALKYPAKSTYFAAQLKELGKSSSSGKA